MNETVSPSAPASPRFAWLPPACAGALAVLMFAWLGAHHEPATMSPDANGYVVQARLITQQGKTFLTTDSPAQFVGMHWLETRDGVFHSRYPAGLPVLYALAWPLGGLRAALLVNPLLASATVLLVFLLARRFADGWSALLAAAVWATNTTVQQHALDADAHIAAAFFLTAGVLLLLRFAENFSPRLGFIAGGLLGIVPTVRYPEALAGVAIAAWLAWRVRPLWRVWPAVLGAALPLGALLIHNASAYGAFWRTGYALTNEQTGFGLNYFAAHWLSYLHSLGGTGLGVFFAFGAAGLAGLVADARQRAAGVLLAGIVVPLLLLYMAYYFGRGDGNLRFLVPLFPLLAAAGAWLLARVTSALGSAGRAVWAAVAVLQLAPAVATALPAATRTHASLRAGVQAQAALEKFASIGSVVIVDHQLGESLDATGEWRLVEENVLGAGGARGGGFAPGARRGPFDGLRAGGMSGLGGAPPNADPDQPSPQQQNKNRAQRARYDGVARDERQARVWADIRAWAGDRPVYWFARSLDLVENALPAGADYESLTEIDLPAGAMGGPGGGGARPFDGLRTGGVMVGVPPNAGGFAPGGMGPPMMNQPGAPGMNLAPSQNQKLRLVKITFTKTNA